MKYAVHPGHVISKNDGEKHYIGYDQLIQLYGVNPKECFLWDDRSSRGKTFDDYTHLHPKYSGNYKV